MKRFAVLVSGSGTNLQVLIDACRDGRLRAGELAVVISNRPNAGAIERAQRGGVPTLVLDHRDYPGRDAYDEALHEVLTERGIHIVVLAGFMRLLGAPFVSRWRHRIVNIHPSLLPSFPGLDAPSQALAAGVKMSGVTIHLVDEGMDTGPILAQFPVPVRADDTASTLNARIQGVEHANYWRVVDRMLAGLYRLVDGRVHELPANPEGEL